MIDVRSHMIQDQDPNEIAIKVAKVHSSLKEKALTTKAIPVQIMAEGLQEASNTARANLGRMDTLKITIHRQKRGTLPPEPASQHDLVIDGEWTITGHKPFFIHENGPDVSNRMIVLDTQEGLQLLTHFRTWYMDGNFRLAQNIYT